MKDHDDIVIERLDKIIDGFAQVAVIIGIIITIIGIVANICRFLG